LAKPAAIGGRDPRVAAVMEDVMRRSATDLKGAFGNYKDEGDEDVSKDGYSMALVPVDEAKMKK